MNKSKPSISSYFIKNGLSRRVIYIETVGGFLPFILAAFDNGQEQLNLHEDSKEEIVEWVIKDILADAFRKLNIHLLSHHRWDEGKVIRDLINPDIVESIKNSLKNRFRFLKDTNAKVFLSGTDLIISVKITNES